MFSIFYKKTKTEELQIQYKKLLSEAGRLSTTNRSQCDKKFAEAQLILDQMTKMK